MEKRDYGIIGVIVLIVIISLLIFTIFGSLNNKFVKSRSLEMFLDDYCSVAGECNLGCNLDSDCVVITCGEFNLATPKDSVDLLDKDQIKQDLCPEENQISLSEKINARCSFDKCIL